MWSNNNNENHQFADWQPLRSTYRELHGFIHFTAAAVKVLLHTCLCYIYVGSSSNWMVKFCQITQGAYFHWRTSRTRSRKIALSLKNYIHFGLLVFWMYLQCDSEMLQNYFFLINGNCRNCRCFFTNNNMLDWYGNAALYIYLRYYYSSWSHYLIWMPLITNCTRMNECLNAKCQRLIRINWIKRAEAVTRLCIWGTASFVLLDEGRSSETKRNACHTMRLSDFSTHVYM